MKDVDPRVFTRIVTDGSVTISPRNFVGEGIIKYWRNIKISSKVTLVLILIKYWRNINISSKVTLVLILIKYLIGEI